MESFVSRYGETISRAQLAKMDNHYEMTWRVEETFDAVLFPIIHSAGDLLLSKELGQVKECPGAAGCSWIHRRTRVAAGAI
jgi:predicted RNA-binding Zn ribbon-like protein